jgi:hypothetical protein
MVTDPPFDDEITSPDDFRVALRTLLFVALKNDIDPRGAWEYRTDGAVSDWEVMMVRLESDHTPE